LVADKSGAQSIRMSNQFAYNNKALDSGSIPLKWKEEQLELEKQTNQFFSSHGSNRSNVILDGKEPTFYFYLSDLQLEESTQEQDLFYAARCIGERPNVTRWRTQAPRRGPSAVVASSTTYNQDPQYYKSCLVALSRLGWETILVVGSNSSVAAFNSLPPNCQPVQNIPLVTIMPHVDLIICAAGMATAMESLYHGLPMLMLTSGHAELEAYARKFHNHGMGIHLEQAHASVDEVAQCAARTVNDTELRSRVKRMQDKVKRSAGAEELVNWLEEHMAFRLR
jgi:MGT family glycosyltransferase